MKTLTFAIVLGLVVVVSGCDKDGTKPANAAASSATPAGSTTPAAAGTGAAKAGSGW